MSGEPDAPFRRQEDVTAHPPVPEHAAHDRLLVLRHAAGDPLDPVEQRDVAALLAGCPACASLPDEVARIAAAVRTVPPPPRPRDFRLGAERLAAHRPGRLARLLGGLPGIASPAFQPLAGAAIAIGLVVAGLGALPALPASVAEPAIVMSGVPGGSPVGPEDAIDARAAASAASDAASDAAGAARMAPPSADPEVALLQAAASPGADPNAVTAAAADAPVDAAADAAAGTAAEAAAGREVPPGPPPGPPPQVVLGLVLVLVGVAGVAAARLERRGRDPLLR